jgi:acetylornithine/N-succinyldiaminopimelate aminotransferase
MSNLIHFVNNNPLYITKAKDCYMYGENGEKFLDFESGDWSVNLGHSAREIVEIIKEQSENLIHDGLQFKNHQSEYLSVKLLQKLGFENGNSIFLNSGSEAVNLGITIAKRLTGRPLVLKMDCSYLAAYGHGQITGENQHLRTIPINQLDAIEKIEWDKIALFVLEAGNSWGLIKLPKNDFIQTIASKIKNSGGLLMSNEVTLGFGRTGKWFGFQHYDYKPDIVSFGKALGNGYPISGVTITGELNKEFLKKPFRYAQSHQNDPLGCAIGLAVVEKLEKDNLIEYSKNIGNYFLNKLNLLKTEFPDVINEIRGRGLMIGIEFNNPINTENIYIGLLKNGCITGQKDNVIRFMPPLIITKEQIDKLVHDLKKVIKNTKTGL